MRKDEEYSNEISAMLDELDGTLSEESGDFEFIDALVCDNCGYHAQSTHTIGSMCLNPKHPIMNVPENKACKDHHLGTLPEGTETTMPLRQQFLSILHTVSDARSKYPRLHRSLGFAIKYQKRKAQ